MFALCTASSFQTVCRHPILCCSEIKADNSAATGTIWWVGACCRQWELPVGRYCTVVVQRGAAASEPNEAWLVASAASFGTLRCSSQSPPAPTHKRLPSPWQPRRSAILARNLWWTTYWQTSISCCRRRALPWQRLVMIRLLLLLRFVNDHFVPTYYIYSELILTCSITSDSLSHRTKQHACPYHGVIICFVLY